MFPDTDADRLVFVTHHVPFSTDFVLTGQHVSAGPTTYLFELLLDRLSLVEKSHIVVIKQTKSLQLNAYVGEEGYLVTGFERLDTHPDCEPVPLAVLDFHVAVFHAPLIQANVF